MTRTPPVPPPTLLITNDRGRAHLLARAERSLPPDEVIVQVKDIVGRRRSFRTLPSSPRAQLVASEPALVLRGGITALVSYYRVPADELDGIEEHGENGKVTHTYPIRLRIACRGAREARPQLPA